MGLGLEPRLVGLQPIGSFSGFPTFIFCSSESGDFLTGLWNKLCVLAWLSASPGFGKALRELIYNQ